MRKGLFRSAALVLVVASGCNDSSSFGGYPRDGELRLNHMQVLGSHNSYHVRARDVLFEKLRSLLPGLADTLEYTHLPLPRQFDEQGIRQIELDVFADPAGGLYARRGGLAAVGLDPISGIPELSQPGFKVLHVQDFDFETTCLTFVACLEQVRDWSDAHPGHAPILVLVEAKDDVIPDILGVGFATPIPIGPAELDAIDAEIRSVFPAGKLITPDEVRGDHATLLEAIDGTGWPTLAETRGRVLFALDNTNRVKFDYVTGHPSLQGRVMFTSSVPPEAEAAFVKLNDAIGDRERITELVQRGFIVRTRADADTFEARSGDTTTRDAALAGGAQFVSTDYPVPDPDFGTGYFVEIPGGMPARCNPVSAPSDCTAKDIEDPALLG